LDVCFVECHHLFLFLSIEFDYLICSLILWYFKMWRLLWVFLQPADEIQKLSHFWLFRKGKKMFEKHQIIWMTSPSWHFVFITLINLIWAWKRFLNRDLQKFSGATVDSSTKLRIKNVKWLQTFLTCELPWIYLLNKIVKHFRYDDFKMKCCVTDNELMASWVPFLWRIGNRCFLPR